MMSTYTKKSDNGKCSSVANKSGHISDQSSHPHVDSRPEALALSQLQIAISNSSRSKNMTQLKERMNQYSGSGQVCQLTAVAYTPDFAAKHIYPGASDQQALERAASRPNPALHNHVLTDSNQDRDAAFGEALTTACHDQALEASHEFAVATNVKKTTKMRDAAHPLSTAALPISSRKNVANYDLISTVDSATGVLHARILQNAPVGTVKSVKD
jgi:hypothetical protein